MEIRTLRYFLTVAREENMTRAAEFVREGLGYQLAFEHLIDTSPDSGLVFRPLSPKLETRFFLIWNKYQTFTPIAERFLAQVRESFLR